MKLLSIETTPNPNSMKLNLDERLAKGVAITYTHENRGDCPAYIEKILAIPGVSSVFRVEDFMAIQRKPTAGWEDILSQARAVFEYASLNNAKPEPKETSDNKWREVTVAVQYFRDLPMLVKLSSGSETTRLPLPERFGMAIERAMGASENMLMERKWKDEGLRYGDLRDVGEVVVREPAAPGSPKPEPAPGRTPPAPPRRPSDAPPVGTDISRVKSGADVYVAHGYQPEQGIVLKVERGATAPATLRPGSQVVLGVTYTILAPPEVPPLVVKETRTIRFGDQDLRRLEKTVTVPPGTYSSEQRLTVPPDAAEGPYTVTTTIELPSAARIRGQVSSVFSVRLP